MSNPDTKTLYAQIYRETIRHHRNQMKFLAHLIRGGGLNQRTGLMLMKSHAKEIRDTLNAWELSYPAQ